MEDWKQRESQHLATSFVTKKNPPQLPICPINDFADSTVEFLIDPMTRHWLIDLVDGLFVAEDVEMIKKKKNLLSQVATEDVLYKPYSSNEDYNCKLGYRFLKEEAELAGIAHVPPLRDKHVWKRIWFMQVQQKVKTFIWRARRNAMSTKQALV